MKTYFAITIALLIGLTSLPAQVPTDVDPLENAAVGYWKAFAMMVEPSKSMNDLDELINKEKDLQVKDLQWLHSYRSSIKEAIKMSSFERCRFVLPVDYPEGFELLLPHLGKVRLLAKILVLDALRLAKKGQWQQAMDRYVSVLRMAEHVQQDPCLICFLVAKVIIEINQRALLSSPILKKPEVPIAQLQRLQKNLALVAAKIDFKKSFAGEKLLFGPFRRKLSGANPDYEWIVEKLMPFLMDDLTKEQKQAMKTISSPFASTTSQKDRERAAKIFRVPVAALQNKSAFGKYLQTGIEQYESYIDKLVAIVREPFQDAVAKLDRLEQEVASNANLAIRTVMPAVKKVAFQRNYEYMCAIRMTQIVAAIASYYRQQQRLPRNLDELDDIPRDPYTQKHFAYSVRGQELVLQAAFQPGDKKIMVRFSLRSQN